MKFSLFLANYAAVFAHLCSLSSALLDLLGHQTLSVTAPGPSEPPASVPIRGCPTWHTRDRAVHIHDVQFRPRTPVRGQNLTLDAFGKFTRPFEQEAYFRLIMRPVDQMSGPAMATWRIHNVCDHLVDEVCPVLEIGKTYHYHFVIPAIPVSIQTNRSFKFEIIPFSQWGKPLGCIFLDTEIVDSPQQLQLEGSEQSDEQAPRGIWNL